jgi:hypothetical protein
VAPAWALSAAVLFSLWPWRPAAAHLAVLALVGIALAEFSFDSVQRIPFACSYLPGKSNMHVTFWFWIFLIFLGIIGAAANERKALESPIATAAVLASLGIAAGSAILRNNRAARPSQAELRYEEIPPDQLIGLELS